ncbi:hypothetical protein BGZ58_003641, partial [Dissophora ornata]
SQRDDGLDYSLEEERNIVALAECGYVFQVNLFNFVAQVGDYDLWSAFTEYFKRCRSLTFNKDAAADFLVVNGILYLKAMPTRTQEDVFET